MIETGGSEMDSVDSVAGNSLRTEFPYIRTAESPNDAALGWADFVVNADPGAVRREGVPPQVSPVRNKRVRILLTAASSLFIEPASVMTLAGVMSEVSQHGWFPAVLVVGSPDQTSHAVEIAAKIVDLLDDEPEIDGGTAGWTTRLFEGNIVNIPPIITRMFLDVSETPPDAHTAEVVIGSSFEGQVQYFRFLPPENLVIPSLGIPEPTTEDSLLRDPDAVIRDDGEVWYAPTEAGSRLQTLASTIPFGEELDSFARINEGIPSHLRVTIAALFDSLYDPEFPNHDPGLLFMHMDASEAHTVAALSIALWNHYAPKFLSTTDAEGDGD